MANGKKFSKSDYDSENFRSSNGDSKSSSASNSRSNSSFRSSKRNSRGSKNNSRRAERAGSRSGETRNTQSSTVMSALVNGAGTFSFHYPLGAILVGQGDNLGDFTIPGIASFGVMYTPGISSAAKDPINVAGRALFDFVNSKNSRNLSYNMPDLMVTLYAIAEAYHWNLYLEQVYKTAKTYSVYNRYMPKDMLYALGVDADSVLGDMADFLFEINRQRRLLNALCLPAAFPLLERMQSLTSAIFADSESVRAQSYVFRPAGYGIYSDTSSSTGGSVAYKFIGSPGSVPEDATATHHFLTEDIPLMTVKQILAIGDNQINALLGSESVQIISTDVLKAFDANLWQLTPVTADDMIPVVYSEDLLASLKNADIFVSPAANPTSFITQNVDSNVINCSLTLKGGSVGYWADMQANSRLIVSHEDNPDPVKVFNMLRFKQAQFEAAAGSTDITFICCGSEILLDAFIFCGGTSIDGEGGDTHGVSPLAVTSHMQAAGEDGVSLTNLDVIAQSQSFTQFPMLSVIVTYGGTATTPVFYRWNIGDLESSITMDVDDIRRINETDIMLANGLT